jgi:hypothetical protein
MYLTVQGEAKEKSNKASLQGKGTVLEDFAHDAVSQGVMILGDFTPDYQRNFVDVES